jgi:hypothetical protein
MLDKQRVFIQARGTARIYSYDLSLLGGVSTTSNALRLMCTHNRHELISHDVVHYLILAKWHLFTLRRLKMELSLYIAFISVYVYSTLYVDSRWSFIGLTCEVILLSFCLRKMMMWIVEFRKRGKTFAVLKMIYQADRFTGPVYFLIVIEQLLYFGWVNPNAGVKSKLDIFSETLRGLGAVLMWVRLLHFAEPRFQSVGVTMAIVRSIIADISVYVLVQIIFLLAYSHAMAILFRNSDNENFNTASHAFVTLGFFVFNMDTDTIYREHNNARRTAALWMLATYMSLVVVVFLNLVIAVMTNSYEMITRNAYRNWLLQRAKFVVRLEDQETFSPWPSLHPHFPKIVAVLERSDGINEIRVPRAWLDHHQQHYHRHSRHGSSSPSHGGGGGGNNNKTQTQPNTTTSSSNNNTSSRPTVRVPGLRRALDSNYGSISNVSSDDDEFRDPNAFAAVDSVLIATFQREVIDYSNNKPGESEVERLIKELKIALKAAGDE